MTISTQQAQGTLIASGMRKYRETRDPGTYFQGFFPDRTYGTTIIPLSVRRFKDQAAEDVVRGTNGNLNSSTIESIKEIIPPLYHEKVNVNSLRNYERAFGQGISAPLPAHAAALAEDLAEQLTLIKNKIIR